MLAGAFVAGLLLLGVAVQRSHASDREQRRVSANSPIRAKGLKEFSGAAHEVEDESPEPQDMGSMLSIETITEAAALEGLAREWEILESGIEPRTPFRSVQWHIFWWKHFGDDSTAVRDELRIVVLRDEANRLVGIAPMMRTCRPGRPPHLVRELQFFGSDPYVTEVRGPICRVPDQARVLEALDKEFQSRRSEWDWIQWCGINRAGGGRQVLERSGSMVWRESVEEFHLKMPQSWEEFRFTLSRNTKESIRKCYNSLKRDGHEFTFRVVTDPSQSGDALDRFLDLHERRSRAKGMVRHANVFASTVARAFLLDYGGYMAARGGLCVFEVLIADRVIATRVGFKMGDSIFLYFSGYAPEWSKYSVMTTVVVETLRWCIDQGIKTVHLSTGRDLSKLRWGPVVSIRDNGIQFSRGWWSAWRFRLFSAAKTYSRGATPLSRLLGRMRRNRLGESPRE
ncbi:CelD/BcsL family acetyltransferase involved in cellulose biosynthesis [Panacagrimonas perspica]|uniref:CelD/BcsL family acetyltransferase involved in cellulose biosynthesis n=1 Tax=Panacagrimonas perspica TaxID=381431 RepID=A0A4V3URF4_9GAMM|nr:GNAT family N-acetyltransferase [Panacagrimonas perspica]TDU31263.1 CelD/BcsL family acetyltransferase involved in cellulose biosynthesis [Panacagrimonas perspica]THD02611.1 hypothetical protein B1810_13765 [Panacagrimonas perspica]